MIDDAEAQAVLAAPCISLPGFTQEAAVRAVLRSAVLRWYETGSGAVSSKTDQAGPFSQSVRYESASQRSLFSPTEITQLRNLCDGRLARGVFSVDLTTAV